MRRFLVLLTLLLAAAPLRAATVLVEAESFADRGGWVIDSMFVDQMGSSFLLAHGMGEPVKPASTTVTLPKAGAYRVFVRTRDWAHPHGPGAFALHVDGKPLDTPFGTKCGPDWTWQAGGTVTVDKDTVALTLVDKTGFEGRCDAILFTDDANFTPPTDMRELAAFRRKALGLPDAPPDAGQYDLVVVGGGIAGTSAAVAAARMDLKVALIQNRPVLGGNASSEIRVRPEGKLNDAVFPRLSDIVNEVVAGFTSPNTSPQSIKADATREQVVRNEPNISLFLNTHVYAVEKAGKRIKAVVARDVATNRELRFPGKLFADCTGDANVGFLAGADFRQGREGFAETGEGMAPPEPDKKTMGTSNMWYAKDMGAPSPFPADLPWALQFSPQSVYIVTQGNWDWEGGMNMDTIRDAEQIRDHNFRAIYGNWSFVKNKYTKLANWKLDWVAYVGGRRESRRLIGDVILSQHDIQSQRKYPDGCVTTGWPLDLHEPADKNAEAFPGQEFRSKVSKAIRIDAYDVPYRCFYSRNVDNLFMAGRNISVTHVALGTVRVQKTTGMMGVAIGRAAVLATRYDTTPRGVYEKHLDELKKAFEQPGKAGAMTRPAQ